MFGCPAVSSCLRDQLHPSTNQPDDKATLLRNLRSRRVRKEFCGYYVRLTFNMDPVSFAASIATLLGMAKGVEETIRALLRVKNASKELQSLINDVRVDEITL